MTHKHAEFFIAIANGESPDDWEYKHREWDKDKYHSAGLYLAIITLSSDSCEVRRKQKTHIVNGFTVPAPMKVAPANETLYFVPNLSAERFYSEYRWINCVVDGRRLEHGLVHLTKEAAIANAKAIYGIDPESDDE